MAKKVYVVAGRKNFEGPWKGLSIHVKKPDANTEVKRLKMFWDEVKVITEFDYLAAQYFRPEEKA